MPSQADLNENRRISPGVWWDFIVPAAVLAVLTLLVRSTGMDLRVSALFYEGDRWPWHGRQPWAFIYDRGVLPALMVGIAGVIVVLAGVWHRGLLRWRLVATYLLLVLIVGPGIVVNAVFKESWGRPRPVHVEQFGGHQVFEEVWEYDAESDGKSFPSGHASMGFYFFALFFALRGFGRRWATGTLVAALAAGLILGMARVVQGGHFVSDVLWSAGFCWFTAAGLAYGFGFQRGVLYESARRRISKPVVIAVSVAALAAAAIAVATPYRETKRYESQTELLAGAAVAKTNLTVLRADVRMTSGPRFLFESEIEAFGFPGSKVNERVYERRDGDVYLMVARQRLKGFFALAEQPTRIVVPEADDISVRMDHFGGNLRLTLRDTSGTQRWDIVVHEGSALIEVPSSVRVRVVVREGASHLVNELPGLILKESNTWRQGAGPPVALKLSVPEGQVRVVPLAD